MPGVVPSYLNKPIPKLYEDEHYIVFDKPAGLLVIPTPAGEAKTLTGIVNHQYAPPGGWRLHPCHRLDRETSGTIIYAKGKAAQQAMMALFHRRAVDKMYVALVHGRLQPRAGELRTATRNVEQKKFQRQVRPKPSVTRYKVVAEHKGFSVVEAVPLTGRTNQIRIQFSQIGHPLVGERKYARGGDYKLKFRRAALHASELMFVNPLTHRKVRVTLELPKDMVEFIDRHK